MINQFLVGVWALSGGRSLWPGWVMLGWSVGLVLHGSYTYRGYRPISEDVIRPEMGGSG